MLATRFFHVVPKCLSNTFLIFAEIRGAQRFKDSDGIITGPDGYKYRPVKTVTFEDWQPVLWLSGQRNFVECFPLIVFFRS